MPVPGGIKAEPKVRAPVERALEEVLEVNPEELPLPPLSV
jgi:hypothetical protein